jgi:adenylosuccinate lyase
MGFKFANFLYEMTVAESFLERVTVMGKFSGAVGTFASLGTREVQASIMAQLGITPAPISTQV